MQHSKYFIRFLILTAVALILFAVAVPDTYSGQSTYTDPDDLTALANFKKQRSTGTAIAFGKTQTAIPKSPTPTITRTATKGTTIPTVTSSRTPSPTIVSEATLAIRAYAQTVLGVVANVDTSGNASNYIGLITTVPIASISHNSAINTAAKNYGAALSNGGAVLSYGLNTVPTTNELNIEVQNIGYATYTLIINANGSPDTPTPATGTRAVFINPATSTQGPQLVNTAKFDPAGTLTALPTISTFNPNATLTALPTLPKFDPTNVATTVGATQLTQQQGLDLAKNFFPLLGRNNYLPLTLTFPSGYAWYSKGTVSVFNPRTLKLESLNQTVILYVAAGKGGKAVVSATVARGNFSSLLNVP